MHSSFQVALNDQLLQAPWQISALGPLQKCNEPVLVVGNLSDHGEQFFQTVLIHITGFEPEAIEIIKPDSKLC